MYDDPTPVGGRADSADPTVRLEQRDEFRRRGTGYAKALGQLRESQVPRLADPVQREVLPDRQVFATKHLTTDELRFEQCVAEKRPEFGIGTPAATRCHIS